MAAERSIVTAGRVPPSDHFRYERGTLCADGVALTEIAEQLGTPSYVYSAQSIDRAYTRIDQALASTPHFIAYAMKANGNLAILRRLCALGAGVDIVSGGELARALHAGFPAGRIVFSGVGKTDAEIRAALTAGVRAIHAESAPELDVIEAVARELGVKARVALRVNPNVDPETHAYIATGLRTSKFGLALETAEALIPRLVESPHIDLEGLACHIGSMVQNPAPIGAAVEITARFARECARRGAPIKTVDAGGGWPITYGDEASEAASAAAFGRTIIAALERGWGTDAPLPTLALEPGRSIVGDAGVLLTRVVYVKEQGGKRFVIVDAAMTELIRPALYGAYHAIVPVAEAAPDAPLSPADVVGPVCESGDFFAHDRSLPPLARGDLLVLRSAGAYSAAMASTYNARPLAAEIMVEAGAAKLVRRRQPVEALWQLED